ncbi:MAG: ATP-binding cassette domain-containing protein [Deltaproteobacteria bacterium]|nr:ATP-binding cassette domain-containing protein [Deltaproteobacteria bacterium]MBI3295215.1 ATP-binding cassette domain-containing protein [Deltaproteobacteria bacterium]
MEEIIKIERVKKRFGDKVVHREINLTVHKGEVLTLMGGSGTGKSVLLRSLIGLDRPDGGSIFFHDDDILKFDEDDLLPIRKRIAYVFQYGALFDSFTVFENLAYPLREHTNMGEAAIRKKVLATLERVGLRGNENLFPSEMSGGMQRRVGVARSIVMDPEVILYDEPTSGLDPFNTRQIVLMIEQLKSQGTTSILVTHDMPTIFRVSDRIAFLREGRIDTLGTRKEIQQSEDPDLVGFINGEKM